MTMTMTMTIIINYPLVREDVPEGTMIATLHATDLDNVQIPSHEVREGLSIVKGYLEYYIVDGNQGGQFKVRVRGKLLVIDWLLIPYLL